MRFASAIAILLLLSGCSSPAPYAKDITLMDTFLRVEIKDALTTIQKSQAADKAISRMKELEERFNYFADNSELTRINRLKEGEELLVSPEMFKVLRTSKILNRETLGAFDVTMGLNNWILDEKNKKIRFKKDDVKINLGGIAKGFIVDEGIKVLKEEGVKNALINAGGDMYCMGEGSGGGWKIGIRNPKNPSKVITALRVKDKGVATSGGYERPSHIIDPRTRRPVKPITKSVTLVAGDCMTSDGLATALYVLGPQEGLSLINGIDGVECVIVDEKGDFYTSAGLTQTHLTKF